MLRFNLALTMIVIGLACQPSIEVSKTDNISVDEQVLTERSDTTSEHSEESVVQALVLDDFVVDRKNGMIFLDDHSVAIDTEEPDSDLDFVVKSLGARLLPETVLNFKEVNNDPGLLTEKVCRPQQCRLTKREEAMELFVDDRKRLEIRKKYPRLEGLASIF